MIAQVGKHLRKWLLGLAVAVRNQAQAVVAKMESAEAEAAEGADREAAPGALKTARSGEPPAHWVQLVERHAPELLLPGPPDTVPRAFTPVFETDAAGGQSAADSAQDPPSAAAALDADKSLAQEGPAFALKLPRLWRKHSAPSDRRPPPVEKKPTRDSDRSSEAAAGSPRDDAVPHTPLATPAGSAKVDRAVMSAAGAEKTRRRRFLRRQPNASSVNARAQEAGTRNTATPAGWIAPARRFGSAAGRIEKNRPVGRERQNIRPDTGERFQPPSRSGKDVGSIGGQAQDRQAGIQTAAGTPVLAAIKQEAADENGPRPNESSFGRPSLSDSGFKTSALSIKGNGQGSPAR